MATTCSSRILVGNVIRITATFDPDSGTVALADVTFTLKSPDGTLSDLTPVVEDSTNVFIYDYVIPDNADPGRYAVRAESDSPSPVMAEEATFQVHGSKFT